MSDKIKVRVHRQEVTLRLKGIYHNKIYHDETLEGEGRIDDKLRVAEVVLKHIDDNTELGNRAINIANQATVIANNAENIANRANETSARAEENSLQAISTANSAKSAADTALSNSLEAIEKSELAIEHSNTALANSEQAVETSGRAEVKADSALSASERAESNSEISVATSERAEQKAGQAVTTAQEASATAGSASQLAQQTAQTVTTFDGRIQQAQEDSASALSRVGAKQDQLTSANAGIGIAITVDEDNKVTISNTQTSAEWGNITGNLADQKDLSDALGVLSDRIDNVEARGRFLALWNATTGLPESNPGESPYTYKAGDYYIVSTVGETNYKPSGTQFVAGQPSTEVEAEELATDDVYYYDGAVWRLQVNHGKTVSFANLAGQPEDNTALKNALDSKQNKLVAGTGITIENDVISSTTGTVVIMRDL